MLREWILSSHPKEKNVTGVNYTCFDDHFVIYTSNEWLLYPETKLTLYARYTSFKKKICTCLAAFPSLYHATLPMSQIKTSAWILSSGSASGRNQTETASLSMNQFMRKAVWATGGCTGRRSWPTRLAVVPGQTYMPQERQLVEVHHITCPLHSGGDGVWGPYGAEWHSHRPGILELSAC